MCTLGKPAAIAEAHYSCCVYSAIPIVLSALLQRKVLVDRTLETEDQDAVRFLTKVKERMDR